MPTVKRKDPDNGDYIPPSTGNPPGKKSNTTRILIAVLLVSLFGVLIYNINIM